MSIKLDPELTKITLHGLQMAREAEQRVWEEIRDRVLPPVCTTLLCQIFAEKVMEVLRQVEWALTANEEFCPYCYWLKRAGHKDGCKLNALLIEGEKEEGVAGLMRCDYHDFSGCASSPVPVCGTCTWAVKDVRERGKEEGEGDGAE